MIIRPAISGRRGYVRGGRLTSHAIFTVRPHGWIVKDSIDFRELETKHFTGIFHRVPDKIWYMVKGHP